MAKESKSSEAGLPEQQVTTNEKCLSELRAALAAMCEKTQTSSTGMQLLVNYYITGLHWTEEEALRYALTLFDNGTIAQIKMLGKNGEEL